MYGSTIKPDASLTETEKTTSLYPHANTNWWNASSYDSVKQTQDQFWHIQFFPEIGDCK